MNYQQQQYEKMITVVTPQIAQVLESGANVIISRSRSGIKLSASLTKHIALHEERRRGDGQD